VLVSTALLDRLNSLLRAELAAVAWYQKALRTLKQNAVVDTGQIFQLASDHQRTVAALQGSVRACGGAPAIAATPSWEGSDDATLSDQGAPAMMEGKQIVRSLLAVELRGLAEYESAVSSLDEDARELVELELIPRQRRHIASLAALLAQLTA
jgi:hypothetical protein